jgi:hypothetical protein
MLGSSRVFLITTVTQGFTALMGMGLEAFAFEAVMLMHPEVFSDKAVEKTSYRTGDWETV